MNELSSLDIAGITDVGKLRAINEDSLLIDHSLALYAIADGMGGHGAGDVASQTTVQSMRDSMSAVLNYESLTGSALQDHYYDALIESITTANDVVYQRNLDNGFHEGTGMGTTLVGLCYIPGSGKAISFNIGDSRLYRYRNGELVQLTRDHTMYQDWEDNGRIGPAPPKNIIMRALGLFPEVETDVSIVQFEANDTFILCSDGLSGMVDDSLLLSLLADHPSDSAEDISKRLTNMANQNGGEDNITVVTLQHAPSVSLQPLDTGSTPISSNG